MEPQLHLQDISFSMGHDGEVIGHRIMVGFTFVLCSD